jgi:hypothetical protein
LLDSQHKSEAKSWKDYKIFFLQQLKTSLRSHQVIQQIFLDAVGEPISAFYSDFTTC